MARQTGIIKIEGQIGDLSLYKTQDGYMVRQKGGVSGSRIASDPAFQRTRENGKEFAASATAGKMLRDAIRPLMLNAADNRAVSRLTKLMSVIKNLDSTSDRGERNVGSALTQAGIKDEFKGFDFNINATLGSKLFKKFDVTLGTGAITMKAFVPLTDILYPEGATHIAFKGAWARVDFASGAYELEETIVSNVKIDGTAGDISLIPTGQPAGPGTDFYLLRIEFYQEVNAKQYSLKNGSYNVLNIVEVG